MTRQEQAQACATEIANSLERYGFDDASTFTRTIKDYGTAESWEDNEYRVEFYASDIPVGRCSADGGVTLSMSMKDFNIIRFYIIAARDHVRLRGVHFATSEEKAALKDLERLNRGLEGVMK